MVERARQAAAIARLFPALALVSVASSCASRPPALVPPLTTQSSEQWPVADPRLGSLEALTGQIERHEGAATSDQRADAGQVLERAEREEDRPLLEALRERDALAHSAARGVIVVLPDVVFEFGSATLTAAGRRAVRDVASVLLDQGRGRHIAVEGHTDSIGAELFNRGLSERRSASVARELRDVGVSEALIHTEGYGSRFPIAPNSDPDGSDNAEGRAKNRRVEIVVER